jgi:hypothetical protein
VECRSNSPEQPVVRTVTRDVSAGGVCFDVEGDDVHVGANLVVDLIVPPGDGHFPYSGRIQGDGEVVRVEPYPGTEGSNGKRNPRILVAAQFKDSLKLHF